MTLRGYSGEVPSERQCLDWFEQNVDEFIINTEDVGSVEELKTEMVDKLTPESDAGVNRRKIKFTGKESLNVIGD